MGNCLGKDKDKDSKPPIPFQARIESETDDSSAVRSNTPVDLMAKPRRQVVAPRKEEKNFAQGPLFAKQESKEKKKRKPDMETRLALVEEPYQAGGGILTYGLPPKQVKVEHILELPAKGVRGPPPLTPYPEPEKTAVITRRASPPGGWEGYYDQGELSSTTTSGILDYIPLIGGGIADEVRGNSSSSDTKQQGNSGKK